MEDGDIMHELSAKEKNKEEGKRRARELAIEKQIKQSSSKKKGGNNNSTRHGAKNQHRHKHFAKWLISTFPHILNECIDNSSQNPMHILDVAGGKGELSARLSLCHSLRVVMVDPRQADIASVYMDSVVPKLPNKWQASIEKRIEECPTFVQDLLEGRFSQLVIPFEVPTIHGHCEDEKSADTFDRRRGSFRRNMSPVLHEAVQNASLIIGLHADGATEAIVDAALFYNKPFVVVPCCVFPNLFNNRYITVLGQDSGDAGGVQSKQIPVRTYDQFCEYLLNKDARAKREVLPFEGRNVGIWWDGR